MDVRFSNYWTSQLLLDAGKEQRWVAWLRGDCGWECRNKCPGHLGGVCVIKVLTPEVKWGVGCRGRDKHIEQFQLAESQKEQKQRRLRASLHLPPAETRGASLGRVGRSCSLLPSRNSQFKQRRMWIERGQGSVKRRATPGGSGPGVTCLERLKLALGP